MKNNACKTSSDCGHKVVAYIVLAAALAAGFLTQSWEAFTLGLFVIAAVLFRGKKHGCSPCNGCGSCSCCCGCFSGKSYDAACEAPAAAPKKTAGRKKTTKKSA